jgi:hypothetical protein
VRVNNRGRFSLKQRTMKAGCLACMCVKILVKLYYRALRVWHPAFA